MTTSPGWRPPPTQVIDWLFAHFDTPSSPLGHDAPAPAAPDGPEWEVEPPPLGDAADLQAANEWFRRERARLRQYTETQLARIRAEHQSLLNQKHDNEQSMILGGQELTRKENLLARHSRALQQQALELSKREQALSGNLEHWALARGELDTISQTRVRTEQETEQLRALLAHLRDETAALQKSREATQAELETMARALEEQREERAKDLARTRANQDEMERRLRSLDLAEQAAQRRVAELDELEVRLREEVEEQERRLAAERRDLDALYTRLRQGRGDANGLAEQAAQRRVAELDELEVRLREEVEEQERRLAAERRDLDALYTRLRQGRGDANGPADEGAPRE